MVNDITQTVASEDLKLEETVAIVDPKTHPKGVPHMARNVIIVKRRDITPNVVIRELDPSLHIVSLERVLHDMEQEPHGSSQYFEFEQDSIQVIHFGNNVKGFKGNSNVLFDEIDGPNQRILTDLHIQGASHAKDLTDVSSKNTKAQF